VVMPSLVKDTRGNLINKDWIGERGIGAAFDDLIQDGVPHFGEGTKSYNSVNMKCGSSSLRFGM